MKRETLERRKRFADEVAARDAHRGPGPRRSVPDRTPAQDRPPTEQMLLQARASVARRLVAEGVLDCADALAFAVWPTREILDREAMVGYGTLTGRAFGRRGNA